MNLFLKDWKLSKFCKPTLDMVLVPFVVRISTPLLFCFNDILPCGTSSYDLNNDMWLQFTVADVFLLHVTKCHEWLLLVSTCFFVLSFSFAYALWYIFLTYPQQHTIHVVVSCIFTIRVVPFCRSAAFFPQSSFSATCSKVSSQITWMFPRVNEAEMNNGSLYADQRKRKTFERC